MSKKSAAYAALVLAGAVGLSACTVTPPHVTVSGPAVAIWAPVPPPVSRVEVMPAAPGHDYFWVSGYWHWEGERHIWREGHWERLREREHWVPHRWDRDDDGRWRLSGGYWHRD
jgi:WXXGXW repeat (2 copies)